MRQIITAFLDLLRDEKLTLMTYSSGVGGSPQFDYPVGAGGLRERLRNLADVYTDHEDLINGRSPHAERLAIVLTKLRKYHEAKIIFNAITKERLVGPPRGKTPASYESTADKFGELGYEGLYRLGIASKMGGDSETERKVLELIAACDPKCYPIRMQDIMVKSLKSLVTEFNREDLLEKLGIAKDHQD